MSKSYDELGVICDRYQDPSLKNETWQKKSTSLVEYMYQVHSEMKLTMSLRELLSASSTKAAITAHLAKGLRAKFGGLKNLVIACDNVIEAPS